jgi:hypothetical protein
MVSAATTQLLNTLHLHEAALCNKTCLAQLCLTQLCCTIDSHAASLLGEGRACPDAQMLPYLHCAAYWP